MAATPDPDGVAADRPAPGQAEGGDAPRAPHLRSIAETWTEVVADAGGLVRAEAALARAETAENLKAVGRQSARMIAGLVLMVMALVFLTVAVVVALAHLVGLLLALLITAAACLGIGLALVLAARNRLSGQQILPERALGRMSRDLERMSARAAPPPTAPTPAGQGGPA